MENGLSNFWEDKKVLITGGHGFLGKEVLRKLYQHGLPRDQSIVFHKNEFDLTKESNVKRLFDINNDINIVIHLAALVGGIGYNMKFPGTIFYDNLIMNTLLMEYSRLARVDKFIGIGSICSYPKFTTVPFREDTLWDGYPEETNATYGFAKKMMLVQGRAYSEEFAFNAIHLLIVNMYGPGDNIDPENSHVIPGLINKVVNAKRTGLQEITVWGTGNASREFLYVEDGAEAIVLASEKYNKPDPVNIGTCCETSIKKLVELIASLVGFEGKIVFDKSKPDGQPRRALDVSKANKEFGFRAKTSLEEGLRRTIAWYEAQN